MPGYNEELFRSMMNEKKREAGLLWSPLVVSEFMGCDLWIEQRLLKTPYVFQKRLFVFVKDNHAKAVFHDDFNVDHTADGNTIAQGEVDGFSDIFDFFCAALDKVIGTEKK